MRRSSFDQMARSSWMRRFAQSLFLVLLSLLVSSHSVMAADKTNVLPNPGFEDGKSGWSIGEGDSDVLAESARTGKMGLRITNDRTKPRGSNATSASIPVTPGKPVTVSFWARTANTGAAVYVMYAGENGKGYVKDPAIKNGYPMLTLNKSGTEWKQYTKVVTPPDKARTLKLWVHTWSTAMIDADLDDFEITGLPADTKPILPNAYVAKPKPKPIDFDNIPKREKPLAIVIKLDDLKMHRKTQHPRWTRVVDYLNSKGVKGTMGMLANSLENPTPEYIQWVKKQHESGNWEIWFHGWDHATHVADDGKKYNEFNHRTFEEQKARLDKSQKLCYEHLGFHFTSFGPPGGVGNGSQDANTHRMMIEDPYMTAWIYPQPMDKIGKETMEKSNNKIIILDRVWSVGIEASVGRPHFERFVRGYLKYPDRDYFTLQGHPVMWDDYSFEQFTKIVEFLIDQGATFVLPSAYAQTLKEKHASAQ
ncbi:MAG: polysaccharide deacetylase [Phycisphaeraceae bacterium]|nr:polysaccharide deacetylase [Phycisphaeraceae bacterium]